MSSADKQCVTPRGHGDGDGIRQNISSRKRVPVSSARKFNARAPRDESLKLQLKTALDEICRPKKPGKNQLTPNRHQKCLQKSASVAEITPTTTKARRRSSFAAPEDSCELYATPRPLDDTPRVRFCTQDRTKCRMYRRLMLLAWRRSRACLSASKGTLKKQEEQINQLEMQVDVLNNLRTSEGQKREETLVECQKLKKTIEILEFEIESTQRGKWPQKRINFETQNLQNTLEIVQNELKVAKSENNFLSEQTLKIQENCHQEKAEKKSLEEKIRLQEQEMTFQKVTVGRLEEKLKTTEKNLQNAESNYKIKERKYAHLQSEFQKQIDANNSLSIHLQSLSEDKMDVSIKIEKLKTQLNEYIQSCEVLKDANEELTHEIQEISIVLEEEQKQTWVKSTKQVALLSLKALQKVAYIMLPAYLDPPPY